jgi:hypothetical protein
MAGPVPTAQVSSTPGKGQLNGLERTPEFGTYLAQRAADDGLVPHSAAYRRGIQDHGGLKGDFAEWGGWGSNPRPADYEKYGLEHRMR